jgi:hypothetical protein
MRNKFKQEMQFGACTEEHFQFTDEAKLKVFGISDYACPSKSLENWRLRGNFYSQDFWYVQINLRECNSLTDGVTC